MRSYEKQSDNKLEKVICNRCGREMKVVGGILQEGVFEASVLWSAVIRGTARFRSGADPENLDRVLALAAAHGAAVRDQQTGGIQFQRVDARLFQNAAGPALFPHDGRAAAAAFHIEEFGVVALEGQWSGRGSCDGCGRIVHIFLPAGGARRGAHGLAQFLPASLKISTTRRKARARALALRE